MIRRLLATLALLAALLPPPAIAQDEDQPKAPVGLRKDLYGKWRMVYIEGATCGYGNILVKKPPNPNGEVDADIYLSCGGQDYVYTFEVMNAGPSHFIFRGIKINGPQGEGPNRLRYELVFHKLDCTLAGRWLVDLPIGRMVMRKMEPC